MLRSQLSTCSQWPSYEAKEEHARKLSLAENAAAQLREQVTVSESKAIGVAAEMGESQARAESQLSEANARAELHLAEAQARVVAAEAAVADAKGDVTASLGRESELREALAASDFDAAASRLRGRGFYSSTSHVNLSRFWSLKTPSD